MDVDLNLQMQQPACRERSVDHLLNCIRDEVDYRQHMDYIHSNPVKHGYVTKPRDWQYSTFHHNVARGLYDLDWEGMPIIVGRAFD